MANRKVTQERVEKLIEGAAYLQKEAEALQYVIEEVPYDAAPPEGYSIAELLMLIDHAQFNYYEPVIDDALDGKRPTRLHDFSNFQKDFNPDERGDEDIQALLKSIAQHRVTFVNKLKDISLNTWEVEIYDKNREILLADVIEEMIHNDQVQLKKITNLVKSYQEEKSNQREIQQRRGRKNINKNES